VLHPDAHVLLRVERGGGDTIHDVGNFAGRRKPLRRDQLADEKIDRVLTEQMI